MDEADETEAEKQKKTEVEAAEKTEDRKKSGNVKIDDVWEYYTTDLDYDLDEVAAVSYTHLNYRHSRCMHGSHTIQSFHLLF